MAPLDTIPFDQQGYLRDIQQEMHVMEGTVNGWREGSMYRTPMYWSGQLLCPNWTADVPHSKPIDDFTEQDFLTS